VFANFELQNFIKSSPKIGDLIEFHSGYKFLLLSKSTQNYQRLGQIVANRDKSPMDKVLESYRLLFLETVAKKSSAKKIYNVLEHMVGFIKDNLEKNEKEEFQKILLQEG
jgi:uncharacterized protein YbgA (DUF1722 family)